MVVLYLRGGFLAEEEAAASSSSSSRGRSSVVRGAFYAERRRDRFVRACSGSHTRTERGTFNRGSCPLGRR